MDSGVCSACRSGSIGRLTSFGIVLFVLGVVGAGVALAALWLKVGAHLHS
jgi:hypothetical protein